MKERAVADSLGFLGLGIYGYAWYVNVALPVTTFAQEHWGVLHTGLPIIALGCLGLATAKGHRGLWVFVLAAFAMSMFLFFAYGDL